MLPLGSELKEKEVQALVEVQDRGSIGSKLTGEKTIVIKDGIIVEIR